MASYRRLLSTLCIAFSLIVNAAGAVQPKTPAPDFAYPAKVSKASEEALRASLSSDDSQATVRALIDYTLAQGSIAQSNLPSSLALIDSVATLPATTPVTRAMLRTLQATIYAAVYNNERWKYDRRTLPLTPRPEDMNEWSGEQFREVITDLYDRALSDSAALQSTPLQEWKNVVGQDRMTAIYYPTLLDFVASKAIEDYQNWSAEPAYFPYPMIEAAADINACLNFAPLKRSPLGSRILELYTMLIDRTRAGSASDVNYRLGRLSYLLENSADSGNDRVESRYDAYTELYRSLSDGKGKPVSEYVGDILLQLPLTPKYTTNSCSTNVYELIGDFLKIYPRYWRADCLRNILDDLARKEITVEGPGVTIPGRQTVFKVIMQNVTEATLSIYDVSSSSASLFNYTLISGSGLKPVATLPIKATGKVPFSDTLEVSHVFPACGAFIAVPSATGAEVSSREGYTKIRVSELAMIYSALNGRRDLWTVSATDGKPQSGVKLSINAAPYRDNSPTKVLGTVNDEGLFKVPASSRGLVTATKGNDRFAAPVFVYEYTPRSSQSVQKQASAYTSLPLYHHGDTVAWSAICYESIGTVCRPRAGEEITVVLRDANYQNLDTLKCRADRFGRVEGSFALPAEGLSGHYSLLVDEQSAVSFEVSDYKLPTFQVLPSGVANDTPAAGDVTMSGKAVSYSGFPVQNARVEIKLSVSSGWRWGRSYEVETFADSTDASGKYSLVIPAEVFKTAPLSQGYYTASVSVTSTAGETQTATQSFSRGKRYRISVVTPAHHSLVNTELPLAIKVRDYADSIVNLPVTVTLSAGADTLRRVVADSKVEVNLQGVKQGIYTLSFECTDAETIKREIILYDPSATESPCPQKLIWSPEATLTTTANGQASWTVAASRPLYLLATLSTTDSIITQKWVELSQGFNRVPLELPQSIDKATLTYAAFGDYRADSRTINVTRANSQQGLKIITETFRERYEPGATETVTFRVVDLTGQGREAAVIAGMYNAAINAIAPAQPWSFSPALMGRTRPQVIMSLSSTWSTFRSFKSVAKRRKCADLQEPAFNTWGRSMNSYLFGGLRVRGMYYKSAMKTRSTTDEVAEEEVAYDAVEEVVNLSAAPVAMNLKMDAAAGGMELSEPPIAYANAEGDAGNSGVPTGQTPNSEAFTYREAAAPMAFFRPDLVSDTDGNLVLKFTLPDANATWRLQLLALTDSLLSANFSTELTVARTIMVQPNLPRFVRSGDRAVMPVTVMNSADTTLQAAVRIECFDPATGKNIAEIDRDIEIGAKSSTVVTLAVDVPEGISALGFRAKAVTELGSDGEQSLLPVLPSLTMVTETVPFYLAPGGGTVNLKVPTMPRDGRVSLQVCANPAWSVVTALPGLMSQQAITAPEAARAIFAASVASGLVKDNPEIAKVLKEWTSRGSKSDDLTSMLERNDDLKIMLLNATPWVTDAKNDNERMRRLALLFDTRLINKTLNDNIALLGRLATPAGGWKWSPQSDEASQWATAQVLDLTGRLCQLGYLPESRQLREMLSKALSWETSLTVKQFKKYPEGDYTDYVWRHTLFAPLGFGNPEAAIVNATTQRIIAGWRKASLSTKALDARILYAHGYQSVARTILASIREFAVSDPDRGVWFPSLTENSGLGSMEVLSATAFILETFAQIEPESTEIDGLRQWLILSKSAQNWGSSTATTDIVAAVLTTSRRWINSSSDAEIKVDKHRVSSTEIDRVTGEWETSLDAAKASGRNVKVEVKSDSPAWGALYCRYEAAGDSVKAQSCPELSITRTLIPSAERLAVGQRVTVLLTIKATEDMDYVVIDDQRGACFEPVDQLPATVWVDGVRAYRVSGDTSTRFFIDRLRQGTVQITYDVYVNNAGSYTTGIATAQSQYAPRFTAHSSGSTLEVK